MASIKTTARIDGLKELKESLLELPKATQGRVLKRAVGTAGADFADHASHLAPKLTGRLARSIKVSQPKIINPGKAAFAAAMSGGSTRAEAAAAARAANRAAGGEGRSVISHVGPTLATFRSLFTEFGTAHHGPQPFMRPTWDALKYSMVETIKQVLGDEIAKAVARIAKRAARAAAKST